MHRGRVQVPHAGCGGAGLPALEEVRTGIEDAKPPGRNAGLPDKARREVHSMDPSTDDKPLQHLGTTKGCVEDII